MRFWQIHASDCSRLRGLWWWNHCDLCHRRDAAAGELQRHTGCLIASCDRFRCVAQLVKTCWDAINASDLKFSSQIGRSFVCVVHACRCFRFICSLLKKGICHVPREPNITLLLVCYTLVYLVLIWTMATIVSIATSDSFYSYCCFNCFCSNFYGFVFGIVSFSIFTMSFNCSSCSYHCGFCCCCCKMQEVLMFVRCFLARRLCLKEGYRLRPLTAAWKSFDKSIKRYCKFQIQTSQHAAGLFRDCLACSNHGGIFFLRGVFWSFSVVPQKSHARPRPGSDPHVDHVVVELGLALVLSTVENSFTTWFHLGPRCQIVPRIERSKCKGSMLDVESHFQSCKDCAKVQRNPYAKAFSG